MLVLQILAVLSEETVNTEAPSAENTAEIKKPSCPDKVRMHSPVLVLQILAVVSSEAVNTEAPSDENTAEFKP